LVRDSARRLAQELLNRAGTADPEQLVGAAYREIFGRLPSAEEQGFSDEYLAECSREAAYESGGEQAPTAALATLCQALMCSSQFLYLD
jgi:hypothetical protein